MSSFNPLLGTFDKLEDLFDGIMLEGIITLPVRTQNGLWVNRVYAPNAGYVPLAGLPGSVREDAAIFVRPRPFVAEALQNKSQNGAIGGFRIVRSAELQKHGLLPVYGFDYHRFVSVLLAFVPATEHDRFNPGGK